MIILDEMGYGQKTQKFASLNSIRLSMGIIPIAYICFDNQHKKMTDN